MEIFIDLAKLTSSQSGPVLPGIDLNLSGLVNFKQPEQELGLSQNPLKSESELVLPGFNPVEYFDQIQTEFNKIKAAQESFSVKDDARVFKEAQQNSSIALDPIASYLETRLERIESITNDKDEIRQLIQGISDTRLSNVEQVINNPLNQTLALEKEISINSINDAVKGLIEVASGSVQNQSENTTIFNQAAATPSVNSTLLTNTQESNFDKTSQSVTSLSDTVSNFVTTLINGGESELSLPEPKREFLTVTQEMPRPDFGAASLSALKQIADSSQTLTASAANISNTTTSQYNTNTVNESGPASQIETQLEPGNRGAIVMQGGSSDSSSVYLMQMLNLMKSGQLKVKLS